MPKPTGYTAKGKIEGWLRKRKGNNNENFTVNQLATALNLKVASIRTALTDMEANNQVVRYGRNKNGIMWRSTITSIYSKEAK